MLQTFVPNVLSVQTYVASVLLDVAYVSYTCCKCFYLDVAYVLQCFFQMFLGVFASISATCFKCFICLQTHVANVFIWIFEK
jgi:hypothetical protein